MRNDIYNRAERGECIFEAACPDVTLSRWEELMKGATRANAKKVVKAALKAGVIDKWLATQELRKPYFNPYYHYKTQTHLIYVNSGIEHFIKVN